MTSARSAAGKALPASKGAGNVPSSTRFAMKLMLCLGINLCLPVLAMHVAGLLGHCTTLLQDFGHYLALRPSLHFWHDP